MTAAPRPIHFPLALAALLALALLTALASNNAPSLAPSSDRGDKAAESAYGKLPLSFVPNKGQVDSRARYYAQAPGLGVFFGDDKVTLALQKEKKGHALELRFPGADPSAVPEALDRRTGKVNYMSGSDRSQWHTNLPSYGAVRYESLWPGIDLTFKGAPGSLKYELTLHPGADPNDIRLAYAGASGLSVTGSGALNVATPLGAIVDQRPKTFQRNGGGATPVQSSYALHGQSSYGFSLGHYDRSRALVIDPGLAYATYLGGTSSDYPSDIAVGRDRSAYVVGTTFSAGFPTTPGAFDLNYNGGRDTFVTRLNASGSALVYSTFVGGGETQARSIDVDAEGNAYLTGSAQNAGFPTTPGAYDTTYNGGVQDSFLTKLSPDGSSLVYSTLLGGSAFDEGFDLAVGPDGSAYVTGEVSSTNYPTTPGAYDTSFNGGTSDAYVSKLSPDGSALVYSTYLGGSSAASALNDHGYGVEVDDQGYAYVTGETNSLDFPTTAGVYDSSHNGAVDAFVTKLGQDGAGLVYSTYVGAAGDDFPWGGLDIDSQGSVYVTGRTHSVSFPTTPGSFDQTFNGGQFDAFVFKLDPTASALAYSTYVGSSGGETGWRVSVDPGLGAWIAGGAGASDFPTTPGAHDTNLNSGEGFATRVAPGGSALSYSTFIGGSGNDAANAVATDQVGQPYVFGSTDSTDFPITAGAYDTTFNGSTVNNDTYVVKLSFYDAPASASPLQFSLVPELRQTISASQCQARGGVISSHGAPLAFTSCNPPAFVPGTAARFRGTGNASLTVVEGNLATPADEADVAIVASLTDVRAAAGGDYAPDPTNPDLTLVARLRISDSHNGGGLSDPGTVVDLEFPTPVNCTTTADPSVGSTCSVSATADAVNPGSILEGRSTVVQTFRVRVNDSGPNGVRGDSDDRRLASQGIYIR